MAMRARAHRSRNRSVHHQSTSRLTDDELTAAITEIAFDPMKGVLIKETGGLRKIRVATGGRGKSGGARIICVYFNTGHPIYLVDIFAKNEKDNLSKAERNALATTVEQIKAAIRGTDP